MPNIVAKGSYTMIDSIDGATMLLTNDTIAIPTDSAGANGNYTGASTTFIVLLGAVDYSANWNVTATPSAGIAGTLAGRTYTVTSITADAAYVDLTASQQGFASVTRRLSVVRIKSGTPGSAGDNGITTYTWIKYSDNADGTGLYDTPTTSTKYIGIATNKTTATESTNKADYTWSLFKGSDGSNGLDGLNGASIFLYQRTAATPAVPSTNCTYTFSTGVLTGINNGWVQKIPVGTAPLWVTTATAISNIATDTITPSEWATPVIMAQAGVDGNHGAGSYVITVANQASIPNDAGKDNHILQLSGRAAQSADILTYRDNAKTFSKSYLRGASTWSEFQFVFDGSAIVNGTLAAEALKAETTITDKLYISSTKSKTEMTLSGAGDYRMWSGNADPVLANFSVDKWGNAKINNLNGANAVLTNANVSGTVNASSGSFTGTVNANAGTMNNITIAENCNVLGTVYANKIVGDVLSAKVVSANSTDSAGSGHVVASASVKGSRTHAANLYCLGVTVEVYASGGYRPGGNDQDVPATISGRLVLKNSAGGIIATAPFKVRSGSNISIAAASQSITIQGGFDAGTGAASISCAVIIDSQSAPYGGSAGVRVPAQSIAFCLLPSGSQFN